MPRKSKNSSRKTPKSKGHPQSKPAPAPDTPAEAMPALLADSRKRIIFNPNYPDDPENRMTIEEAAAFQALTDWHDFEEPEADLKALGPMLRAVQSCAEAIDAERSKLLSRPEDLGYPMGSLERLVAMLDALRTFADAIAAKRDYLHEWISDDPEESTPASKEAA